MMNEANENSPLKYAGQGIFSRFSQIKTHISIIARNLLFKLKARMECVQKNKLGYKQLFLSSNQSQRKLYSLAKVCSDVAQKK